MGRLALINNGIVIEVSVGNPADPNYAAWTDVTGITVDGARVSVGWSYNGSTFAPPPSPTTKKNRYSLAQFIDIMNDDELGIILEYVNSTANTTVARKAKRTWERWRATDVVDFNDQRTVDAVT